MNDVIEVALAGFLHDWGKLFQRAEWPLSAQAERMTEMLCPSHEGRPTHRHVLWTNDVLTTHQAWLPARLDRHRIIRLASEHHRPSDDLDWVIAEADRLASGHDRRAGFEGDHCDFKAVPLRSVFGSLRLAGPSREAGVLLPQALRADSSLYPDRHWQPRRLVTDYEAVARQLARTIAEWTEVPERRVCEAVAGLSERFLSLVPASTLEAAGEVSLHDHAYLTAAFASALYVYHRETHTLDRAAIGDRSAEKFILLGGDLSGIQRYLFAVPVQGAKGVARVYRARSFFLSRLTQALALKILSGLELPLFNRVMDAGGRFTLLLPNLPAVRDRLSAIRKEVDEWMADHFSGLLTINLDAVTSASGRQFMGEGFRQLFDEFQNAAEAAKRRKLAGRLCPGDSWTDEKVLLEYAHTGVRQEKDFERDRRLGAKLPDAAYVGLWRQAPDGLLHQPLQLFDLQLQLFSREGLPPADQISGAVDFVALQPREDSSDSEPYPWIPVQHVANYIPRQTEDDAGILRTRLKPTEEAADDEAESVGAGRIATFEHLAVLAQRPASEKPGLAGIACLKADVDRLGLLFSHGLQGDVSIGRTATLSRQLDFFFKAQLQARFTDADRPFRLVYTIFAGGDDLLLVGPWPVMFDLAEILETTFRQFTDQNPDVTLSAAVVLGRARTPVSLLAEAAEQALEDAKNAGRNRISLFREILTWEDYRQALADGRRLDEMIAAGDNCQTLKLNTGFVYRLLQYARMASRVERAISVEKMLSAGGSAPRDAPRMADLRAELTWRSHLMYDLHRNIRQKVGDRPSEAVRNDLNWLDSLLVKEMRPSPDCTSRLKIAATYALYRNRGG